MADAARVRAQVSQLEGYSAAVAAFQAKYTMLPGDIRAIDAAELGLVSRSGEAGRGDGNGLIESCEQSCGGFCMILPLGCEVVLFWSDLAQTGLMDAGFPSAADDYVQASSFEDTLGYLPEARLGGSTLHPTKCARSELWLVAIRITSSSLTGFGGSVTQSPFVRVSDARSLDVKIDDGLAMDGRVRANTTGGSTFEGYYCNALTPPTTCVDGQGEYLGGSDAAACQINYRIATR